MKYNTVPEETTKRFLTILKKLQRHISQYRKNKECQREIFIRRTLNKNISGKFFSFIYDEGIGVYDFEGSRYSGLSKSIRVEEEREIKVPIKRYAYVRSVNYCLGYGEEVFVDVIFAHRYDPNVRLEFSIRDFLKLEFKEISAEEFSKVASMFLVDNEELNEKK